MRLIDADKLYPDCMTKDGKLAISQSQLANVPTVETASDKDIKGAYELGYRMAKEKIIHSIAKQYSEHNELVPIWLSIGDIKGGAE